METRLKIHTILGLAHEAPFTKTLHALAHRGTVETIHLHKNDMQRRRLRATTDQGTECAIALPRSQRLDHGSVLWLDAKRGVVVRGHEAFWLEFKPTDLAAALELGYLAGNMHWRVQMNKAVMRVCVNGNKEDTLKRVAPLLDSGRIRRMDHDE